jgi:hypothetical protein
MHQESKKICKITSEILLYLMSQGYYKVVFDIDVKDHIFTLKFNLKNVPKDVILYMDRKINSEREYEIEEYGWELMGESTESNELEMIGLIVDKLEIEQKGDTTYFTLIRKG